VGIVTRILMLIAVTLLLVSSGELVNGLILRQQRLEEAASDSVQLARIAELDMTRILEGARQVLATLARLPSDHGWDERACAVVEATASSDFEYDNLVAVDRDGTILCSSSGVSRIGSAMPDRKLLQRIITTAGFAVGNYGRGELSKNEVIRVGYPVVDQAGSVVGAIYAGINVTWLNSAINAWHLGENATIDITDRNGILVASYPNSQGVGQSIPGGLKAYLYAAEKGAAVVSGTNGVPRLYGYVPVRPQPSDSVGVFVGRDQGEILATIDRSIWLSVSVVFVGLLLSAFLAVVYVRRFLARPIRSLLTAAGRWRESDWSARAGALSGIPEFDRLTLAFNGMAAEVAATTKQISLIARSDILTGLANRAVFIEALQYAMARTRRDRTNFAVLYLDLDHFKDINDTLGHPVGDLLLQAVAERLRASVRETDTVARFGGDEFAVIEADLRKPEEAALLANKLLIAMGEPFQIQGNDIRISTSIGIALHGPDSANAEALLSHVDVALYRAKADGRGTYRFFTDAMDTEVRTRVMLADELAKAFASGQLFLEYQPQVDADTGRIIGLEALVRWRHPTRGVIRPSQFIPVAEHSGLIVPIGHWVMREACGQMRQWLDAGIAPPLIAVNVSVLQFKTPGALEEDIAAILAETGVPSQRVELELTESVLMDASREHNDVLMQLRGTGFRIAVDDFGTGYSSLDYLRRFPVDRIKIAQQFICDPAEASGGVAIVKAAIGLADALGLNVIIEGVETAAQLELVRSWGCHAVQGHYFSKAVPAEEMTALLRKGTIMPASAALADAAA